MTLSSTPMLPNELISQIIYQYVLGICFKEVLQLRLVSASFDLEVIRALLETIDFRPRVHINWYPLTNRLLNHVIRNADAGDRNYGGYCKRTIDALVRDYPDRIDVGKYQRKLADMSTYCVDTKLIVLRLHEIDDLLSSRAHYGPLFAAIACDDVDIVEQLWRRWPSEVLVSEQIWPEAINNAAQAGSLNATNFLLNCPEAERWTLHLDGPLLSTPLLQAARHGRLEIVKCLVTNKNYFKRGSPIETKYLMQEAAKHGHMELVKYFVEACKADCEGQALLGADTPSLTSTIRTCFKTAAQEGRSGVIEAMLRGDYTEVEEKYSIRDRIILYIAFCAACRAGKVNCARLLLGTEEMADWRSRRAVRVQLQIPIAVKGDLEVALFLFENDVVASPRLYSMATQAGQAGILRWLYERTNASEEPSIPALSFARAVRSGYVHVVEFIAKYMGLDVVTEDVSYVQSEDDIDGQRSLFRDDPILTAMVNGQDRMVEALLDLAFEKRPVPNEVNAKFADGTYPLGKGPYECVKSFVAADQETNVQVWARRVPGVPRLSTKKYSHSSGTFS